MYTRDRFSNIDRSSGSFAKSYVVDIGARYRKIQRNEGGKRVLNLSDGIFREMEGKGARRNEKKEKKKNEINQSRSIN